MKKENNTIARADLVDAVYNELGFSHIESVKIVESLLDIMSKTLSAGKDLRLSGFATFVPRQKSKRMGRNPKTGVEHVITPRMAVSFKASHAMKSALLKK